MTNVARIFWVAAILFALVASPAHAACPFTRMPVKVGTSRLDLESRVAALLGTANTYSPYASNLQGGTVSYRSGSCELRVIFAPGAPAPRVAIASGGTEHLPPTDESVLSHEIILKSSTRKD